MDFTRMAAGEAKEEESLQVFRQALCRLILRSRC
jgi:hypothetical protein